MERIKIDRRILLVETLGAIAFIVETIALKWEIWVIPLIALGIIALWYVHVTQRMTADFRLVLYFIFGMVQVFFHGVHETSMFDIAVVSMLFMVTFSLVDKLYILNAIFVEFLFLVAIQIYLHYGMDMAAIDSLYLSRFILHIGAFICMFIFCRISVSNRNADKAKLEKRAQEIEAYDTDMEDFLSNVSHELRTPVNVVNGMTTLFLKSGDSKEVSAIKTAGVRLQYQIEDIQDYTEIKRGELALEEEKYMSTSLINDVVVHFNLNDRHNELDLVVDLDPNVPSMMKGDIRKIHKLFRHLLDNAIKFTKEGGIYIHVFMVKRDYGINLAIEVTDTGIGMTRDEIAHVSKGMYQANKKRNRSTGGIGIGLAIVYGFVHKMGGFVKIDSRKGEGTTVRLSIPQEVVNSMPCLMVVPGFDTDVVFYVKPEKYQVPQLREFYKSMAVNL
ncbi:MAG: HAMP domain-containing histidine kinase, partial [Lachnospiraceae bacterium]|nr:HAMP domain-containing histidine kinase [Lachnospiraceae bacterium]